MTHSAIAQGSDPIPVVLLGPEILIEFRGVGDVVAVWAARHRREIRRSVAVADPEALQIVDDGVGVGEREGAVELQTIGRSRNADHRSSACKLSASASRSS